MFQHTACSPFLHLFLGCLLTVNGDPQSTRDTEVREKLSRTMRIDIAPEAQALPEAQDKVVRQKVKEAEEFKILKVKLGRENDKEMVETIRSVTTVPICADANQGWTDRQQALDMCRWLAGKGVVFVEQPMPKTAKEDLAWLTRNSPLPIMGDEGVQTLEDVVPASQIYSGINIKLMKCGGVRAARKMITLARALSMKVMIGCMTETSCAISAASQLSPLVDWADLDGNLLIANDIFEGARAVNGKIKLTGYPGIGIRPL